MLKHILDILLRNYRKLIPTAVLLALAFVAGGTDFFSKGVHDALQAALSEYAQKLMPFAIDLIVACFTINLAWLFYKPVCSGFEKVLERSGASPRAIDLSLKLLKFFYWGIAVILVFSLTAAEILGRFVIGFGVFGAALTLAMQGAANDFICGLLIQFTRKVVEKDSVKIEGLDVQGVVASVGYLSTVLNGEGARIHVPNREIWSRAIKVIKPKSPILLPAGLDYPQAQGEKK